MLTRALSRRKEMAVRAALGAGRLRIVRQLLTESLIVAHSGGLLGLALAHGGLRAILALIPPGTLPDESEVVINVPVLLFSLTICLVATLVFGLAPAVQGSRGEPGSSLAESGRGAAGGGKCEAFLRSGLVVVSLGLAAGVFAVRIVESQLWNVPKYDWVSFAGTSALLFAVGMFACFWPSRRASRIAPMEALRHE